MRRLTALASLGLAAALLAGCSAAEPAPSPTVDETFVEYDEGTTVNAAIADFESRVADELEASSGMRPEVDCGEADLDLEDAATVPCTLVDGDTTFDVEVTIMLASDASDYIISARVLD